MSLLTQAFAPSLDMPSEVLPLRGSRDSRARVIPASRKVSRWIALTLQAAVALSLVGCPRHTPPDETLPLVTTDNEDAEAAIREAREAADEGRDQEALERYETYLETYPDDALRPIAEIGLGRLSLAQGEYDEALTRFERVAAHEDDAVAERGRFYVGVTRHLLGEHAVALELLRPLLGRTVDPEETALLLRTLAAASLETGDTAGAVIALDALAAEPLDDQERRSTEETLRQLLAERVSPEERAELYTSLPHDGIAWPIVARVRMREAFESGELTSVETIAAALRDAGETLEPELEAMALRAERTGRADPRVIGALLPLSGRGQEAGQAALRGMALAIGAPPTGPHGAEAFQLVHRDIGAGGADADERARLVTAAVDELVTLHRVIAIIGPVQTDAARVAADRAQTLGVPLIALNPTAGVQEAGENVFRALATPREEVRALLASAASSEGAIRNQPRSARVAVLHASHGYGQAIRAAVEAECGALGLDYRGAASYAAGTTALGDAVQQIAAYAPDLVVLGDGPGGVAVAAPSLAAAGLVSVPPGGSASSGRKAMRVLLPSLAFAESLATTGGRYLDGASAALPFFARPDSEGPAGEFAAAYRARFGMAPVALAAAAFDAVALVEDAAEGGAETRPSMREALSEPPRIRTAGAGAGFGPNRGPREFALIVTLRGGEWGTNTAPPSAK